MEIPDPAPDPGVWLRRWLVLRTPVMLVAACAFLAGCILRITINAFLQGMGFGEGAGEEEEER